MVGFGEAKQVLGEDVLLSDEMRAAIELWSSMYEGTPPWLGRQVRSMGLPAAVASELSRLVTVELKSEITGGERGKYLNEAYQGVLSDARVFTEFGCAKGGLALRPYTADGRIFVDYVQADSFFPTEADSSGRVTGAVFVTQVRRGGRIYTRLERHSLADGVYRVCNTAYVSDTEGSLGRPAPLQSVAEWAQLQPEVEITGLTRPLFAYFKVPAANTVDSASAVGASVFARAVDLIEEADRQYSRLLWEFESGERALYVSDVAFARDEKGRICLPDKRLYRTLAVDEDLFEDWTPTLREENILRGLNAILRKIEFNCGLAYGTLSDVEDTEKTATEIAASKQRSYATVCDIQKALRDALEDLVYSMDAICTLYQLAPAGRYDVSFEFDDSIVADRQTEFAEKQQLVSMGIMQPWEFRMWYFGEDEAEARQRTGEDEAQNADGAEDAAASLAGAEEQAGPADAESSNAAANGPGEKKGGGGQ